jgi:hypothetical protein
MLWILLAASLLLPPVIVLAPPWRTLAPREFRVRLAGAIIVVWMSAILWSLKAPGAENAATNDPQVSQRNFSQKTDASPRPNNNSDGADISERPAQNTRKTPGRSPASKPAAVRKPIDDGPTRNGLPTTQPSNALQNGGEGSEDIAWDWSIDAPLDTGWMLLLGWIPGLAYASLLFLARRGMQRKQAQLVGDAIDPRQFRRPY